MADITYLCLTGNMLLYTSILQMLMCQVATLSMLYWILRSLQNILGNLWHTCSHLSHISSHVFLSFQCPGVGPGILIEGVMSMKSFLKPVRLARQSVLVLHTVRALKAVKVSHCLKRVIASFLVLALLCWN